MAKQKRHFCKPKEAQLQSKMGTFASRNGRFYKPKWALLKTRRGLFANRISLFFYLSLSIARFRMAGHLHYRPLVPEGKEP